MRSCLSPSKRGSKCIRNIQARLRSKDITLDAVAKSLRKNTCHPPAGSPGSCVEIMISNGQLGRVSSGVGAARIDDDRNGLVGVEACTDLQLRRFTA